MKKTLIGGFLAVAVVISASAAEIVSEGKDWPSHLQGVCSDSTNIWWSHATVLARTDLNGKLLATSEPVGYHHGDLCLAEGVLYVAVNHGRFNTESQADSWVYAYDPITLKFIRRWQLPANVHGAGGMTFRDGRFYIIGGLPPTHDQNYVYEYDRGFTLIKRHVLHSKWTNLGIQTADFVNGRFLFACYGGRNRILDRQVPNSVILAPPDLSGCRVVPGGGELGMTMINGRMWKAAIRRMTPEGEIPEAKVRYEVRLVQAPELDALVSNCANDGEARFCDLKSENDALRRENQRLRRELVRRRGGEPVIDLGKAREPKEVDGAAQNGKAEDDGGFWLSTKSMKRHNSKCRYYKMGKGRPCSGDEGEPCRKCGG